MNFLSFWESLSMLQMGELVLVPTVVTLGLIALISIRKKTKNKTSKTQLAENAEQLFNPETYTVNTEEISGYDSLKPQGNKHEVEELEEKMRVKQLNEMKNIVEEKEVIQNKNKLNQQNQEEKSEDVSSEKYLLKALEKESDFEKAKKYIQKAYKVENNTNEKIRIKVIYKIFCEKKESLGELYHKYPSFYKLENLPVLTDVLDNSQEEDKTYLDIPTIKEERAMSFEPETVSFESVPAEEHAMSFEPETVSFESVPAEEHAMSLEPETVSFESVPVEEHAMSFELIKNSDFKQENVEEHAMSFEPETVSFESVPAEEHAMSFEPETVSFESEPIKHDILHDENHDKALASFLSKQSSDTVIVNKEVNTQPLEENKKDTNDNETELMLESLKEEQEKVEEKDSDIQVDSLLEELGSLGQQIQKESQNTSTSKEMVKSQRSKSVWANWMFPYLGKNQMRNVIFDLDVPWGSKKAVENLTIKIYEHMSQEFGQKMTAQEHPIVMISVQELTEE